MPDTGLTAALARIRDRAESLDVPFGRLPQSIAMSQADVPRLLAAVDDVLSLADALATARRKPPRNLYEGGYEDAERQLGKVFREHIARALLGEDGT
jgi:hypothetical protein